jgi:hypothetical protein
MNLEYDKSMCVCVCVYVCFSMCALCFIYRAQVSTDLFYMKYMVGSDIAITLKYL